jgi:hypothetical protein
MTKLFYTLLLLGCVVCTAISCRPEAKQAGQVNIPVYAITATQQELNDRGHDIKVDGIFGPETDLALTIEVCKER